jgi:hypothetical protein
MEEQIKERQQQAEEEKARHAREKEEFEKRKQEEFEDMLKGESKKRKEDMTLQELFKDYYSKVK